MMKQQEKQDVKEDIESFSAAFSLPALELSSKNYSLEADIATGWQPKMKVVGPIPLSFDSTIIDRVVETLTELGRHHKQRVIYLGPRFASSFKLHQEIPRQYPYKYDALLNTNFPQLAAYFRKFYSQFKSKHQRIFRGMNPTLKNNQTPLFDSIFESGNLDVAIKVGDHQYDLFMRVDTNTRGHVQWYYFSIKNNGNSCIKLNIVNFRRHKTLYSRSLRPYIKSNVNSQNDWHQGGNNIRYANKALRYNFLSEEFMTDQLMYNCLSFEYQFLNSTEEVRFAYCPPFTYSQNCQMIKSIRASVSQNLLKPCFIQQEILGQSLGGLQIPLLTVTDPDIKDQQKKCILVAGRIHPGETCGSFMVRGFLQFICSDEQQAKHLRRTIVFKIVPMMNPDGVVVGNFRTSLCGKDLNRMFRCQETLLIPEVRTIKNLVTDLKKQFKGRLCFFIDFHGHSVRKNVFVYGPEYQIWQTNYYRTRILPKLIAAKTDIFRYYSCMFRISEEKRTTARAVLLRQIPHCYTVEASVGSYYSVNEKKDVDFTPKRWEFMGKTIAQTIGQYFSMLENEGLKNDRKGIDKISTTKPRKNAPTVTKLPKLMIAKSETEGENSLIKKEQDQNEQTRICKSLLNEIAQEKNSRINQQQHDSDNFSEGGSDSEEAEDDFEDKALHGLHQQIILSLKEFKQRFRNKPQGQGPVFRARNFLRSSAQVPKRGLQMIASLRKRPQILSDRDKMKNQSKIEFKNELLLSQVKDQPRKSRTQNVRHQINKPQSQSFQVYVNKINFLVKGGQLREDCKVNYLSPRKKAKNLPIE